MGFQEQLSELRSDIGAELARRGLELGAIRLNTKDPFQWASGYRMPIYNDNRTYLQDPHARNQIALGFSQILDILSCEPNWIAGTATAGIPHATTLADLRKLPLCYVRGSAKGHGLQQAIEGLGRADSFQQDTVVLIEDLISTGGSSLRAVEALRSAGAQVPCCLSVFSYGLDAAEEAFGALEEPCRAIPILLYEDLIALAADLGYIDGEDAEALGEWRKDPFGWGEKRGFPRNQ